MSTPSTTALMQLRTAVGALLNATQGSPEHLDAMAYVITVYDSTFDAKRQSRSRPLSLSTQNA